MMLELFAQAGKFGAANPAPPNAGAAAGAGIMVILGFVLYGAWLVSGIIHFVFLIMVYVAQSKALTMCSERRRLMEPGQVWLNFIPCFNIVWFIMTVLRVSESLMKEFRARGLKHSGDYAKGIGIFSYVSLFLSCIPFLGPIVLFMYWKKLGVLNVQLEKSGKASRRSDDDDDDEEEEERPRPKKRRPRDDDDE
jgi:hypothetical protein